MKTTYSNIGQQWLDFDCGQMAWIAEEFARTVAFDAWTSATQSIQELIVTDFHEFEWIAMLHFFLSHFSSYLFHECKQFSNKFEMQIDTRLWVQRETDTGYVKTKVNVFCYCHFDWVVPVSKRIFGDIYGGGSMQSRIRFWIWADCRCWFFQDVRVEADDAFVVSKWIWIKSWLRIFDCSLSNPNHHTDHLHRHTAICPKETKTNPNKRL